MITTFGMRGSRLEAVSKIRAAIVVMEGGGGGRPGPDGMVKLGLAPGLGMGLKEGPVPAVVDVLI